jgi:transcriptional regulator of arginine metabolism
MAGRARRQQVIVELLEREPIDSQEDLRQALGGRGIEVTQATLSRDLRELGAVKTPRGYRLPDLNGTAPPRRDDLSGALARSLGNFVTGIEPAANLIVLRTGPGHAQIVALEVDRAGIPGIVGCLAGDDTIFVACSSTRRARELCRELARLADLDTRAGAHR